MPPAHVHSPPEPLQQRELEILSLLEHKLTNREIAACLGLTYATVKWYNHQIFAKLRVANRREAVVRAAALGLLDADIHHTTPRHNLPSQLTPFVGRLTELEELKRLLSDHDCRLITLLGPGGMGKTRLAIAVAEEALSQFPDGVYFVPLQSVASPNSLVAAIAQQIGVGQIGGSAALKHRLCDFIADKHILLVLDNFERVIAGADILVDLMHAAQYLRLLVTSRERLNLSSELAYVVSGLDYPEPEIMDDSRAYSAVEMFVQAAKRADPHVTIEHEQAAEICRVVQGMPLAIELAGAWASTLTLAEITAAIRRSVDFLSTEAHDVPERQRSVRVVFESVWARLGDAEREAFAALSVFRGGCTQDAALAVADTRIDILAALIGSALIWRNPETNRLSIHELMRHYAARALEESGALQIVQDRYRAHFGELAADLTCAICADEDYALTVLDSEIDNIAHAFECAIAEADPDALAPFSNLWRYFTIRGYFETGATLYDAAIQAIGETDSLVLARLLAGRAVIASDAWDDECLIEASQRSVDVLQRLGARNSMPLAAGMYAYTQPSSEADTTMELYRQSQAMHDGTEDLWDMVYVSQVIGMKLVKLARIDDARLCLQFAYKAALRLNSSWALSMAYIGLGWLGIWDEDRQAQRRNFELARDASLRINHAYSQMWSNAGLFGSALMFGDARAAKNYALKMVQLADRLGTRLQRASAPIAVADACCELGECVEAAAYLRRADRPVQGDALWKLRVGGSLLLRNGFPREAAPFLWQAYDHPTIHRKGRLDRKQTTRDYERCRSVLGDTEFEAAVARTRDLTIEQLTAELHRLLDNPIFDPSFSIPRDR